MDVINKFYSTALTTVSQLSAALPGNNVTKEYEVLEQTCTAGVGLLWKVYNGCKKSTKQEVSVFVFEKKLLDKWSKDDRESMLETLRRGVQQLTKIRHPHVLTVQHPLEESRDSLAFATEPVFASLANVVGDAVRAENKLYDVEIRHGLLQLFDGIKFLHEDAKIIHRNISAETIIINKNRSWKLFGFDFCVANQPNSDGKPFWPCREYTTSLHVLAQPSLEYSAPEIALHCINTPESDLFSLGVLIFTIYAGKPLKMFGNDYSSFRRYASDLNQRKYPSMNAIPNDVIDSVKALLHPSPNLRPKLHEIQEISYFQDVGVKTLSYLDSLYQWDNLQKSKFYKGLPQIIPTLPHRVNLHSILPHLVKEFINSPMIPFVLPNVLLIAEMSSQKEYCEYIFPHLIPIFKLTDPIQILLIFMQKMDLLLKLTPPEDVKMHVLPLLYRSLECDMPQIQELCLAVIPTFSNLIDYNAMKNAVIPRIKKLCLQSGKVSIKVNCLVSIGHLLENLDKWIVLDEILPFLQQIPSREPAIIMAIIGIYRIALTNPKLGITKDILAHRCLPFLVPLCVESGLSLNQFSAIFSLIREMISRVEREQKEKLVQLNTIQSNNKPKDASEILSAELENGNSNHLENSNANGNEDMFSRYNAMQKVSQQNKAKEQQKTDVLKISHKPTSRPDILASLMNSNLQNIRKSPSTSPTNTLEGWAPANNWHSSNPLVMNQQLTAPTTTIPIIAPPPAAPMALASRGNNTASNSFSSLDDLDPFGGSRKSPTTTSPIATNNGGGHGPNMFTLQNPTTNYIYSTNFNAPSNNGSATAASNGSLMKPLLTMGQQQHQPQQQHSSSTHQQQDNANINLLSQQDILNFLN